MRHAVFPVFKDIFPSVQEPSISFLLNEFSCTEMLKILSNINCAIYLNNDDTFSHDVIMNNLLREVDSCKRKNIVFNYNVFRRNSELAGLLHITFMNKTILDIILEILRNSGNLKRKVVDRKDLYYATIQLIFLSNTVYNRKLEKLKGGIGPKNDFVVACAQHSFNNVKDIFYQIIASSEFFSYVEKHDLFSVFYKEFLTQVKVKSVFRN